MLHTEDVVSFQLGGNYTYHNERLRVGLYRPDNTVIEFISEGPLNVLNPAIQHRMFIDATYTGVITFELTATGISVRFDGVFDGPEVDQEVFFPQDQSHESEESDDEVEDGGHIVNGDKGHLVSKNGSMVAVI